jgi:hypothetical protein
MRLARAGLTQDDDGWDDKNRDTDQPADSAGPEGSDAPPVETEGHVDLDSEADTRGTPATNRLEEERRATEAARTRRPGQRAMETETLADIGRRLGAPGHPAAAPPLRLLRDKEPT